MLVKGAQILDYFLPLSVLLSLVIRAVEALIILARWRIALIF